MFYVYFAKSLKNGKIYVGKTTKEPRIRIDEHNKGSNKWSKQNGPLILIYYEKFNCSKDASNREVFYKTGVGKKVKQAIVTAFNK